MPVLDRDLAELAMYCDMCHQLKPVNPDNALCYKCCQELKEGWPEEDQSKSGPLKRLVSKLRLS